jgi:hypothetical protein
MMGLCIKYDTTDAFTLLLHEETMFPSHGPLSELQIMSAVLHTVLLAQSSDKSKKRGAGSVQLGSLIKDGLRNVADIIPTPDNG